MSSPPASSQTRLEDDENEKPIGRFPLIHQLFESCVDDNPSAIAVIEDEAEVSYSELDQRANQLARYLASRGLAPGQPVGLLCHRSTDAIEAILAVLKAGGWYVPIDPCMPLHRRDHILNDSGIRLILTDTNCEPDHIPEDCETICLDSAELRQSLTELPSERIPAGETGTVAEDLCYVIYTSGSTGKPKGAMIEHRNVVAFTRSFNQICQMRTTDRVYQGFSLSFDGSIEEIWMTFAHGATLVLGPPELARLGADTADYINRKKVTFFSTVPTFLAMIDQPIPTVRILISGGEALSASLVERFCRPGRLMLNAYGPTETTVNATIWECRTGESVSIGHPMPGYTAYVVDENLTPVPAGTPGELCIGGWGVGRGYLNQPEVTEQKFVPDRLDENSTDARLYRTGDLVYQRDNNEIMFLGRIDNQVSLRGFRIELEEIEAVLSDHPVVQSVAVTLQKHNGADELAAFVTTVSGELDAGDRRSIRALLKDRLPAYMIPRWLDLLKELPTFASLKIDRNQLPQAITPLVNDRREIVASRTSDEELLVETWGKLFKLDTVSVDDNFFLDLGGESLMASRLVCMLHSDADIEISIREVYANPTIEKLARVVERCREQRFDFVPSPDAAGNTGELHQETTASAHPSRWACLTLQAISIVLLYGLMGLPLMAFALLGHKLMNGEMAVGHAAAGMTFIIFFTYPAALTFCVLSKWLIIGRVREGKYPLWGTYYFRYWLTNRIHDIFGAVLLTGTPLMSVYYRLMGASVGRCCTLDTSICSAFDLVEIGDHSSIGSETHLLAARVENGVLHLGRISIGNHCFVGSRCALGLGSRMNDGAKLGDLSLVNDAETLPAGASRSGSPAVETRVEPPISENQVHTPGWKRFSFGMAHLGGIIFLSGLIAVAQIPGFLLIHSSASYGWLATLVACALAYSMGVICFCMLGVLLRWVVLSGMKPGVYPVASTLYFRRWLFDSYIFISQLYAHPVYATIYTPIWLRMLGTRVGPNSEISTVSQLAPDLVELGEASFCADGCRIGGRRFHNGYFEISKNRVGSRSFVGNSAVLSAAQDLGTNSLLGVLSNLPEVNTIPDESEWLGSPAFELPNRNRQHEHDESLTYRPTLGLYVQRYFFDAMRIVMPGLVLAPAVFGLSLLLQFTLPALTLMLLLPLLMTTAAFSIALGIVAVKKSLMGSFHPVVKPLWSRYVWLNEIVNGTYESLAFPILSPLVGTPMVNWFLRGLGCKIGKRTFLGTMLFSEFDLVEIGDDVAINTGVVIQNHLFEDRIMKSSIIQISDNCSIGNLSVVLYDSIMHSEATLGPLSLVMKGATVPAGRRNVGVPIEASVPARRPGVGVLQNQLIQADRSLQMSENVAVH